MDIRTPGAIGPWAPHVPCCSAGNLGVWALEADPLRGRLYTGGDFTQVSSQPRERFAQFSEAPPQGEDCTIIGTPNDAPEVSPWAPTLSAAGGHKRRHLLRPYSPWARPVG